MCRDPTVENTGASQQGVRGWTKGWGQAGRVWEGLGAGSGGSGRVWEGVGRGWEGLGGPGSIRHSEKGLSSRTHGEY